MLTEFGRCKTINFSPQNNLLKDEVDGNRIYKDSLTLLEGRYSTKNLTQPYKTTSPELGITVVINHIDYKYTEVYEILNTFRLIIHSPFELPTKANQQFYITDLDDLAFWVTPQLNTIDDSMVNMKPHE